MRRFPGELARIIPMLLVMGLIFVLSSVPGDQLTLPDISNIDKVAHLAIYGLLAFTVFYAFGPRFYRMHPRLLPLAVIFICTVYGVSDELHQYFVPNRSADIFDVLADSAGAVIVSGLWIGFAHLLKKNGKACKGTSSCL